jgi:hypothetical protein
MKGQGLDDGAIHTRSGKGNQGPTALLRIWSQVGQTLAFRNPFQFGSSTQGVALYYALRTEAT